MVAAFPKALSKSLILLVLSVAHFLGFVLLDHLLEFLHALFGLLELLLLLLGRQLQGIYLDKVVVEASVSVIVAGDC